MTASQNPFPGMNPYLERSWPSVHTRLIGYMADALADQLPPDLKADPEVGIVLGDGAAFQPDVAVVEPWQRGEPTAWQAGGKTIGNVAVTQPEIIQLPSFKQRWIEIRNDKGRLITVIELLSPSNKQGQGRRDYLRRQHDTIAAGVNLVEIDLIRRGQHVVAVSAASLGPANGTRYLVCAVRADAADHAEVYRCPLAQRLPAIRVPLRPEEPDAVLDLQPLVDKAYEKGRGWLENYQAELEPPLPVDEASWVEAQLKAAGLAAG